MRNQIEDIFKKDISEKIWKEMYHPSYDPQLKSYLNLSELTPTGSNSQIPIQG